MDPALLCSLQSVRSKNGLLSLLSHFSSTGEILAHTLKAFMELMEHDFVSWETLSAAFIKKVHNSCAMGCPVVTWARPALY